MPRVEIRPPLVDPASALSREFARDLDAIELAHPTGFPAKMKALEDLKRKYLKRTTVESERLEIQRRIAEGLLFAAAEQPWRQFKRYLGRLARLGYGRPDVLVMVGICASRRVGRDSEARAQAEKLFTAGRHALEDVSVPPAYRRAWTELLEKASKAMDGSSRTSPKSSRRAR